MITKDQCQELRKLADQATAGPWEARGDGRVGGVAAQDKRLNGGYFVAECYGPRAERNSRFIAAARPEVVLALLDRLDELSSSPSE
ncbi:MAG: ead/Ea22-like family protein [Aeromonas sobria]